MVLAGRFTPSVRTLARLTLIALAATAFIAAPAQQAFGTTYSDVDTEAEFRDALDALSIDGGAGPHVIDITGDFTISDPGDDGDPVYTGTVPLSINGNEHAVSGSTGYDGDGVRFLDHDAAVGVTVNDLTIDNFRVVASGSAEGGAIRVASGGDLTLYAVTMTNNRVAVTNDLGAVAVAYGGAVFLDGGDLSATDSAFQGNYVSATSDSGGVSTDVYAAGGAIATDDSGIVVEETTFADNTATADATIVAGANDAIAYARGGAIYTNSVSTDDLDFESVEFDGNLAEATAVNEGTGDAFANGKGGAIRAYGVNFEDDGGIYKGNAATAAASAPTNAETDASGGAFAIEGTEPSYFDDVIIKNNSITAISIGGSGASDADAEGGAVDSEDSYVNIFDSTISGNTATADAFADTGDAESRARGGAVAVAVASFYAENTTLSGNLADTTSSSPLETSTADVYGGAVAIDDGSVELFQAVFKNNSAVATADDATSGGTYGSGGAVSVNVSGGISSSYNTFQGNSVTALTKSVGGGPYAEAYGGALDSNAGMIGTDHDNFISNTAAANAKNIPSDVEVLAYGGAISSALVAPSVADDYFAGNEVSSTVTNVDGEVLLTTAGGAIGVEAGIDVVAENSTFASNSAWADADGVGDGLGAAVFGGAIHADDGAIAAVNSTFFENSVELEATDVSGGVSDFVAGGAIMSIVNEASSTHSTFVDNWSADGAGDHVAAELGLTASASVFAGATGDGCIDDVGGGSSDGYNFEDEAAGTCTDGHDSAGDFGAGDDPELAPLAYAGGFTPVMEPASTSPLVGHIPGASCVGPAEDQRGVARPSGPDCEPGAVEYLADRNFTIPTSFGLIPGTASGTTCSVFDIGWTGTSLFSPAPPADVIVPYGLSEYTVCPATTGGSVTITLDLPSPVNTLYKVTDDEWGVHPGATFAGTTVTFVITDGGLGDDDGSANGEIVDPVGPAIVLSLTG